MHSPLLFSLESNLLHNARLRGRQRYYQASAQHRNHKNQRIVKMPRVGCPS
ncbi:Uncharacterised protein [Vibrio cholerae]|nr:Uncharacterised protein [Vibrio cholerae]CSC52636.1 Uncharacterised protein [Vibrio cholerae]CSD20225.1 Uncharacterised protein [Vibrio cholerae]